MSHDDPAAEADYLLGHDAREWSRLREQHALWRSSLLDPLARSGALADARILEVGCGGGDLLCDLLEASGAGGRVSGLERDPRAVERARGRCPRARVFEGDLMTTELGGPYDLVVARWVFSFLPDVAGALARLRASLAPGGLLAIQDYDHDAVRLEPACRHFDGLIEAFREAYRRGGGDLWVALRLPALMRAAGLEVELIDPRLMAGGPDSEVFHWVERFLHEHLETVIEAGLIGASGAAAFRAAFQAARAQPETLLVSPIQMLVLGRAPL
jgi:SAM-dependent methyltransferase